MTGVPPIYEPPLSEEVIDYAQKIATYLLRVGDYGEDWRPLYRQVRMAMNRRPVADRERPSLDDESISEGIVRAINARSRGNR